MQEKDNIFEIYKGSFIRDGRTALLAYRKESYMKTGAFAGKLANENIDWRGGENYLYAAKYAIVGRCRIRKKNKEF